MDNALAIRLSVPSHTNTDFPATDSGLRQLLLNYAEDGNNFDSRDHSKDADHQDSVEFNLNLSHQHNLKRISSNPVAAVEYFRIAFDAIVTTLFAVHPSDGKTELLPLHHDMRRGIFGRLTNLDANIEASQRKTLHFHSVAIGVISPNLLGSVAHSPVLMHTVSEVFDSMICASLPIARLLEHVVSEEYKMDLQQPAFASQAPPVSIVQLEHNANITAASTKTCMHFRKHCNACVKCGRTCCRFAKPSGLVECTGMRMVSLHEDHADNPDPRSEHFVEQIPVELPKHDYTRDPIEPLDARPIVFEILRPPARVRVPPPNASESSRFHLKDCMCDPVFADVHPSIKEKIMTLTLEESEGVMDMLLDANGLVSEFNHVLMSAANCNMAILPLGTAASAKASFMYTAKYICKNPAEIMSLLSILHDAAKHIDKYPSTAPDSGTDERDTRHYLQRILNKLCGREEYGANQVVAALIQLPAEFQMHKCSQIYADSAARYAAENNNPPIPDPPPDSDAHDSDSDDSDSSEADSNSSDSNPRATRTPAPLQRETPLLDLLPTDLSEDEEFGALAAADCDSASHGRQDSPSPSESAPDSENDADSHREINARDQQPSDAFTEIMDSNQTYTGSVQITSFDDDGSPRTSLQHQDYHFRPTECSIYALFEFGQTMKTVEKGKEKEKDSSKNIHNAGRKPAARFEFKEGHPLRATHECQIMVQHTVPNIVRRIPPYPGPRPSVLTAPWKSAARLFAYHVMVLYKPWEGPEGIPPAEALTWKAMHVWLNELRAAPADDIVCRTRLQFVTIAAHGLKISSAPNKIITKHRFRAATRLNEMQEEDRPAACSKPNLNEARIKENHTAEEGQLAIKSLLQRASAAFDDKTRKMQGDMVDFLSEAFPHVHQTVPPLTQASSPKQCLDFVGAAAFDPDFVKTVHSSIMSKSIDASDLNDPPTGSQRPAKRKSPAARSRAASKSAAPVSHDEALPSFVWSFQQLQIINVFEQYCKQVAAWKHLPNRNTENLPSPPHMLIQGGPGSGKSAVTRRLTQLAKTYQLSSISSAMTAVAALNMENASTYHSAYHVIPDRRKKGVKSTRPRNANLQTMSSRQERIFASKLKHALDDGTPVITFIDEVSLSTAIILGHVIQRYRQLEAKGLVIGPFILVGDFFQVQHIIHRLMLFRSPHCHPLQLSFLGCQVFGVEDFAFATDFLFLGRSGQLEAHPYILPCSTVIPPCSTLNMQTTTQTSELNRPISFCRRLAVSLS